MIKIGRVKQNGARPETNTHVIRRMHNLWSHYFLDPLIERDSTRKHITPEKYIRELHSECSTEPAGVEPATNQRSQAHSGMLH